MQYFGIKSDAKAYLILGLFTLLFLSVLWKMIGFDQYPLDDSYIVEHSVAGFLSGQETRYIGSTPWEGVTSPIYVGLIALFSIVMPISYAHWLVSSLSIMLMLCGFYKLSRTMGVAYGVAIVNAIVPIFAGITFYQITNGLETTLAIAVLTWILVAILSPKPHLLGYVLVGISGFIRPELAVVSFLFGLSVLYKRPENWLRGLIVSFFSCVTIAGPILFFSGHLVPNTIAAKAYFFVSGCLLAREKIYWIGVSALVFLKYLGFYSVGLVFMFFSRVCWIFIPFALVFFTTYYVEFPKGLLGNHTRYVFIMLPFIIAGWSKLFQYRSAQMRYFSFIFSLVLGVFIVMDIPENFKFYHEQIKKFSQSNREAAQWVDQNIDPHAVILVQDAGKISEIGKNPLVDLVGIKSPFVRDIHKRITYAACELNSSAMDALATQSHASYIILTKDWERVYGITTLLQQAGWHVDRADGDRGNSFYQVYKINKNASER